MNRVLHASCMAIMALTLTARTALAQSVSWQQVVGIIPASNTVGVGMGTLPGGFLPWTTTDGAARVNLLNGEIRFSVRGLVFAGGAGTPGPITGVKGVLLCDADGSAGGEFCAGRNSVSCSELDWRRRIQPQYRFPAPGLLKSSRYCISNPCQCSWGQCGRRTLDRKWGRSIQKWEQ